MKLSYNLTGKLLTNTLRRALLSRATSKQVSQTKPIKGSKNTRGIRFVSKVGKQQS